MFKHMVRVEGRFLGAFEILRKANISFVMSVRLSAWNNWTDCHEILYLSIFPKYVEKNSSFIKI